MKTAEILPNQQIHPKLARPHGYQSWGHSHENSQIITGESARIMGIPGYRMQNSTNKNAYRLAIAFLSAIAESPGSPEPLYHGFQNVRKLNWNPGQVLTLPLMAASGDMDGSANYGIKTRQRGAATVFEFPIGTPMAGYAKWGNADAADFGYTWSEAIVAGKFVVRGITQGKRVYNWADMPEYTIVHLHQRELFDPTSGQWRRLASVTGSPLTVPQPQ